MIRCQLIHLVRNPQGRAIRKERRVSGDTLSIGRASECKIHLQDHRVSLHHAVILHSEDGRIEIETRISEELNINQSLSYRAELHQGTRVLIGPYELIVESVSADDISLTYELLNPLPTAEQRAENNLPLTLKAAGLSMRIPTIVLTWFLLLSFLVAPIIYALSPPLHQWESWLPIAPDEAWNAGQMSPSHRSLSRKCLTCHQTPFHAVSNAACKSCHQDITNHIANPTLHDQVFHNVACSSCHLDHRGKKGLVRQDDQQCVGCHGNLKAKNSLTRLPNIHDFTSDHPSFQLKIQTGPNIEDVHRIPQSDTQHLVEHSGLKFSHQVHFDKALIQLSADKTRDISCNDCHVINDSGMSFKPINMVMTCQQSQCHSLELTPTVSGRKVPHASVNIVINSIREYYSRQIIERKSGTTKLSQSLYEAGNWVTAATQVNTDYLFTKSEEGTCLECHEISKRTNQKETSWKVAPVRIMDHWLPKTRFPHDKHRTSKCTDCHDVLHSKSSQDVAMPNIQKCRECHVGQRQSRTRISSTCSSCHHFHGVISSDTLQTTTPSP